jgi:hypothetical protein
MSDTYRKASRMDWQVAGADENLTTHHLSLGCLQRIADATEVMAKNNQGLLNERDQARKSRDYWQAEYDSIARRLIAARGQITKLKKRLATA